MDIFGMFLGCIMFVGTHEFEGVLIDEGGDVGGPFSDDFFNEWPHDGIDVGLEVVSHLFSFFFHEAIINRKENRDVKYRFRIYWLCLHYCISKKT
jgi:hypothetical protein